LATAVYGGEMYAVRGSYDDCSRLVIELAGELDWAFVNVNLRAYYAEGSKTLAFEIVEQLGWELPDAVIAPVASGSLFTKIWQGFEQFRRLGLVEGDAPRIYGGQAQGCSPVASAFADERPVSPVRPETVAKSLEIGANDRVVVLVTGTGLKTPQLVETRPGTEIEADVDELLAGLGVG